MGTLLLRLAAPLQAWGTDSKFDMRQTGREPSRSGVIGLIACALGIPRDDSDALRRLNGLTFGVRVEQEGMLLRDYHTVKSYKSRRDALAGIVDTPYQTHRYYLADAVFLAALSGEDSLLKEIDDALRHPAFPLYLGRRSCPPTLPVTLGLRPLPLREALLQEPWHASESWQRRHPQAAAHLRLRMDAQMGDAAAAALQDVPLSFDPKRRAYAFRMAAEGHAALTVPADETEHDAMAEVMACT